MYLYKHVWSSVTFFPKTKITKEDIFINENKRKSLSGEDFTVVSRTRNAENAVEDRREVCPVENVSLIEARADVHETSLHLSPRPCWTNTTRSPWPSRKTVWSHLVNMNVTSLVASREREMAEILWKWHKRSSIREETTI